MSLDKENLGKKYGIQPYKAMLLMDKANKIVKKLFNESISTYEPFEEAKIVLDICYELVEKAISLRYGVELTKEAYELLIKECNERCAKNDGH